MKTLYREFNELNTDFDLQPIQVDELEKGRIKHAVMKKVKKTRRVGKLSAAAILVASASLVAVTLNLTNPVLAAKLPLLGNIFEFFKDDNQAYVFDEYNQYSTEIGTTKESSGIEITVTNAVYDGESVTITYTLKSEEDFGERAYMVGDFLIQENENGYKPGSYFIEKINDKEYAGMYIRHLMNGPKPDKIHVKWLGDEVYADKLAAPISGEWAFEFTLDAIERKEREFQNHFSSAEGMKVRLDEMVSTPVSTTLSFTTLVSEDLKGWTDEAWETVHFEFKVSDDLGNEYNVLPKASYGNSKYHQESRITLKAIDKNASSLTITPMVELIKKANANNELELVKEPYPLESIKVNLKK